MTNHGSIHLQGQASVLTFCTFPRGKRQSSLFALFRLKASEGGGFFRRRSEAELWRDKKGVVWVARCRGKGVRAMPH